MINFAKLQDRRSRWRHIFFRHDTWQPCLIDEREFRNSEFGKRIFLLCLICYWIDEWANEQNALLFVCHNFCYLHNFKRAMGSNHIWKETQSKLPMGKSRETNQWKWNNTTECRELRTESRTNVHRTWKWIDFSLSWTESITW